MSEWKEYSGSDDQISEMRTCKNGYVVRRKSGEEVCFLSIEYKCRYEDVVSYWIIPDDPLREMKIRQAVTGQPVWVRVIESYGCFNDDRSRWVMRSRSNISITTTPDWNIPVAEYSFTEFKEEVCKDDKQ